MRIMEHVAELNETGIIQSLDKKLTPRQVRRLLDTIDRLKNEEPLEYIVGSSDFHGRRFYVSKSTLIPRIETEMLVNLTVGYAKEKLYCENFRTRSKSKKPKLSVIDVGAGTGCIIISTALMIKEPVAFYATEISQRALDVAQKNTDVYKLKSKIRMERGNLLEPIDRRISFDIIVANLPYIRTVDIDALSTSVKDFEPRSALDGGENGAKAIRELLVQSTERLNPKGVVLLEIQPKIISTVTEFANRFYPDTKVEIHPDTFKEKRYLVIRT